MHGSYLAGREGGKRGRVREGRERERECEGEGERKKREGGRREEERERDFQLRVQFYLESTTALPRCIKIHDHHPLSGRYQFFLELSVAQNSL